MSTVFLVSKMIITTPRKLLKVSSFVMMPQKLLKKMQ